jgi:DNA-binding response OmpR family regulator
VVEDDEVVCATLEDVLSAHDFEVVCALGDSAAYGILEGEAASFDVLLLDINLGQGVTGFDVARFARGLNATVPVIYLSGGAEASVERFGVPGSILVAKPFDVPLLVMTLREKLGG